LSLGCFPQRSTATLAA